MDNRYNLYSHFGRLVNNLAIVLDLFSRRIVGWSMAKHMRDSLVQDALHMALGRRQPAKSLLHHSDRGVQYASKKLSKHTERITELL